MVFDRHVRDGGAVGAHGRVVVLDGGAGVGGGFGGRGGAGGAAGEVEGGEGEEAVQQPVVLEGFLGEGVSEDLRVGWDAAEAGVGACGPAVHEFELEEAAGVGG